MDPVATIGNIARLVITICQALKEMQDLKTDATALSKLVRSVQNVIQNAADELDGSQLKRPEAVKALKEVEETLFQCNQLIKNQTAKGSIAKFFSAGDYRAAIKSVTSCLANQLQALQMALGVEQHADLKHQFERLHASILALKLETLRTLEEHAAKMRFMVEQRMVAAAEAGRAVAVAGTGGGTGEQGGGHAANASSAAARASRLEDEELRRMVLECLEQAVAAGASIGVAAGRSEGRGFLQKEIDEAILELKLEMRELQRSKRDQEASYLAQIAEILKPPPVQQQPLHQAKEGSGDDQCSSGSTQRQASLPPPPVPQNFLCPITRCVMRDPVMLMQSGHSFERSAIERHLATCATDPVTNLPLALRVVVTNHGLRGAIEEWLQQNGLSADQVDDLPPPLPQQQQQHSPPALPASQRQKQRQAQGAPATAPPRRSAVPSSPQSSSGEALLPITAIRPASSTAVQTSPSTNSSIATNGGPMTATLTGHLKPPDGKAGKAADNPTISSDGPEKGSLVYPTAPASPTKTAGRRCNVAICQAKTDKERQLLGASKVGDLALVRELLADLNVNPNATQQGNRTALHAASRGGHREVVAILLRAGADPSVKTLPENRTALHAASLNGYIDIVAALIRAGADVDAKTFPKCRTALHEASSGGHKDVVEALLMAGADVDAKTVPTGRTALQEASYHGHKEVVEALLRSGADAGAKDLEDRTALHSATLGSCHKGVVEALLLSGVDAMAVDQKGFTPVLYAKRPDVVHLLKARSQAF